MKINGNQFAERAALIAERRAKVRQMEDLLHNASNRELTPEEQAQLDDLKQQVANLVSRVEALESEMEMDQESESVGMAPPPMGTNSKSVPRPFIPTSAIRKNESDRILRAWFRLGTEHETLQDFQTVQRAGGTPQNLALRTGLVSNATTGSYAVPTTLLREFETQIKSYCKWLDIARVFKTAGGEDLKIAVDSDQINSNNTAVWIDQAVADADRDVTLDQRTLKAYTATSGIQRVSYEILQDNGVDLESLITDALATRIGRLLSDAFTNGSGSNQPTGILLGAGTAGKIQTNSAASATALALDDILNAYSKLDPAYQPKARIMMNQNTFGALLKLKNSQATPYFVDPSGGPVSAIVGMPVVMNPHLPDMASGNVSVVIGDFNQFAVRQAGDVVLRKTTERYWESRQIGYAAILRVDSCLLDNRAFVGIKH